MTRYIRYSTDRNTLPTAPDAAGIFYGILEDSVIRQVNGPFGQPTGANHRIEDVRLLPPCSPTKILCVGRNYADHAKEMGNPVPVEPLIFLKPPSALIAHGDPIVYPALTSTVSYEGELAMIVSKRARFVEEGDWQSYIAGYTCLNDVTARDLQKKDGQWTRGKGFDTFCPVGQWAVPAAEVTPGTLRVTTFLDGDKRQDAPITDLIFSLGDIIAYITQFLTLEPGDLIATGTPPGVGPMEPGSTVRIVIDGVGALENPIKQG